MRIFPVFEKPRSIIWLCNPKSSDLKLDNLYWQGKTGFFSKKELICGLCKPLANFVANEFNMFRYLQAVFPDLKKTF
jgi:hypothetical protein